MLTPDVATILIERVGQHQVQSVGNSDVLRLLSKRNSDIGRRRSRVVSRLHAVLVLGGISNEINVSKAVAFLADVAPATAVEEIRFDLSLTLIPVQGHTDTSRSGAPPSRGGSASHVFVCRRFDGSHRTADVAVVPVGFSNLVNGVGGKSFGYDARVSRESTTGSGWIQSGQSIIVPTARTAAGSATDRCYLSGPFPSGAMSSWIVERESVATLPTMSTVLLTAGMVGVRIAGTGVVFAASGVNRVGWRLDRIWGSMVIA